MSFKFENPVHEKFCAEVQAIHQKLSALHDEMSALTDRYTDNEKEEALCNQLPCQDCIAWSDACGRVERAVEFLGLHFT